MGLCASRYNQSMNTNKNVSHLTIKAEGFVTMTVEMPLPMRVSEARDIARHAGAQALGLTTGMVEVTNVGHTTSGDGERHFAFYQVRAY